MANMALSDMLCCPICKGSLTEEPENLVCAVCGQGYPTFLQIPDLRDPRDKSKDEPFASKIEYMIQKFDQATFTELISIHLAGASLSNFLSSGTLRYYLNQADRSENMTSMFLKGWYQTEYALLKNYALDLGCGSGGGAVALSGRFQHVYALDASVIQLILAKKFIEENHKDNITLICGFSQSLPFKDGQIAYIQAINVLEHLESQLDATLFEIHRCLQAGGYFAADSRNRYDIFMPEPHTGIRLLGFLPRKIIPSIVKIITGSSYMATRLLSCRELSRALSKYFDQFEIRLPDLSVYNKIEYQNIMKKIERNILFRQLMLALISTHIVLVRKRE
jgi:ubiquinone/menaquinone biosynthesis C-methylase UbiE/uncharacterized protein YbaR (Trm112 family)